MTGSGIPLIHSTQKTDINHELFAGFVSAITNFAVDIFIEKCSCIKLASSKLTLLFNNYPDLIFICHSSKNIHGNRIKAYLNKIRDSFLEIHYEDLINFTGKVDVFRNSPILLDLIA